MPRSALRYSQAYQETLYLTDAFPLSGVERVPDEYIDPTADPSAPTPDTSPGRCTHCRIFSAWLRGDEYKKMYTFSYGARRTPSVARPVQIRLTLKFLITST